MDLLNNTRSRLTETEVHAIFNGEPYRNDWNVDRNQADDHIEEYYGELIRQLMSNALFDTCYSEEGGLGNYLECLRYPKTADPYRGNAILVAVSWCAPVAAYGPTTLITTEQGIGFGGLFPAKLINQIGDPSLQAIASAIRNMLLDYSLTLLDSEFVQRPLPPVTAGAPWYENHNKGNQYLQGIFQKTD